MLQFWLSKSVNVNSSLYASLCLCVLVTFYRYGVRQNTRSFGFTGKL